MEGRIERTRRLGERAGSEGREDLVDGAGEGRAYGMIEWAVRTVERKAQLTSCLSYAKSTHCEREHMRACYKQRKNCEVGFY